MSTENKYRIINNLIDEDLRMRLLEKAERHFRNGDYQVNKAGPHRYVTKIEHPPHFDSLVETLLERVSEAFGVKEYVEEPVLNKLISRIEAHGCVHPHTDKLLNLQTSARLKQRKVKYVDSELLKSGQNFRCNVMIQMSDRSGCPVIDGEIIDVYERDAWGFLASKWPHSTQVIVGQPRIIYGFGFIVPPDFDIEAG